MIIAMENSPFLMGQLTINGLPEGKRMFFHFGSLAFLHCKTSMNVRGLDGPTRSCFTTFAAKQFSTSHSQRDLKGFRIRVPGQGLRPLKTMFRHVFVTCGFMPRAMDITGRVFNFLVKSCCFQLFCSS